jgi:hypothetical protein
MRHVFYGRWCLWHQQCLARFLRTSQFAIPRCKHAKWMSNREGTLHCTKQDCCKSTGVSNYCRRAYLSRLPSVKLVPKKTICTELAWNIDVKTWWAEHCDQTLSLTSKHVIINPVLLTYNTSKASFFKKRSSSGTTLFTSDWGHQINSTEPWIILWRYRKRFPMLSDHTAGQRQRHITSQ